MSDDGGPGWSIVVLLLGLTLAALALARLTLLLAELAQ